MQDIKSISLAIVLLASVLYLPSCNLTGANNNSKSTSSSPTKVLDQTPDGRRVVEELTTSYLNKTPARAVATQLSVEQAQALQDQFVQQLSSSLGNVVGYKAGLTNPAAQERFKVSEPIRGVLLEKMLLNSGAVVPANFGTRPVYEGDLMVRVGSQEINNATTPKEALAALDAVIPFMELPDLVYDPKVSLDGTALVAINVGARLGVLGTPIPLSATPDWEERLKNIKIVMVDKAGNELAVGKSSALLGNPLQVVLWLKDSLKASGKVLKKGDLLSLGSMTPLVPVKSGTTIRAQYIGLDPKGKVEISVSFE
ncbi:hydratase [Moorena producens PAL-8-15-08-1]|uniref:Hydratase n=2 Tax=Moorena TaxID=1155738 RepID=A0A1D8U2P2_9CYAN|nr:hydratase [Moorena producens PAL-8-15-08-1]